MSEPREHHEAGFEAAECHGDICDYRSTRHLTGIGIHPAGHINGHHQAIGLNCSKFLNTIT